MATVTQFASFSFPRKVALFRPGKTLGHRLCTAYSASPTPVTLYHRADSWGFYLDSDFMPGLRWKWCDDVARSIRHTGWHTNPHGDGDTIRGVVFALPHGRGYLAGWSMGQGMASVIERGILSDESDAANCANDAAERAAEAERDRCVDGCDTNEGEF